MVALARVNNVAAALRMFTSAGVKVRSIVTPALALMSLARMRRRLTPPGSAEVYVALEEAGTAVALIRDGGLMAARELGWGYRSAAGIRTREDAARRLGDAIEGFLSDCGVRPDMVSQVCICGGMPELRNMTLSLMEHLDVEVEPLDLLFGIDADHLPEPRDSFRERVADLRLAWAVAADWNAPIDFLRERRRRMVKTALTRAAVVGGVAAGVTIAWRLQRSELFQPSARVAAVPTRAVTVEPPRRSEQVTARSETTAPPIPSPARPSTPPVDQRPVQQPSAPAVALTPVPPRTSSAPHRVEAAPSPPLRLSSIQERPAPLADSNRQPSATVAATVLPPASRRPVIDNVPLPFDASLATILYGADRKLAIVDGRIVQIGDDVRGARVIDIMPDAVLFRDVQGRLRKLTLQDSRRDTPR